MKSGYLRPKILVAFGHDVLAAVATFHVALYLRYREIPPAAVSAEQLTWMSGLILAVAAVSFAIFGTYRWVWRFTTLSSLWGLIKAASVTVLAYTVLTFLAVRLEDVPRSAPVIHWLLLVVLLSGSRALYVWYSRHRHRKATGRSHPAVPVLLLGAGERAADFIDAVANDHDSPHQVVGVIDGTGEFDRRSIRGVPVLGEATDLGGILARLASQGCRPRQVVLVEPQAVSKEARRSLLGEAERYGLSVTRLRNPAERLSEGDGLDLRPVALDDLLGRPPVPLDTRDVRGLVAGRRVLVTGAGGTIGSELARQLADLRPERLVVLDHSEFGLYSIEVQLRERHPGLDLRPVLCNVRDAGRVQAVFEDERPDLVFHAAALKHVPMVELHPSEGVLTNVVGTCNVALAAARWGATAFVQVSTDKAVNPTSVMGATKRVAELYCQALDARGCKTEGARGPRFMTVRFGNVIGSSGSVVPLFQRQLARGGPLTVTHPRMRRFFMTVGESVQLVLQASARGMIDQGEGLGQIFVLDMGEQVLIDDLARQMIKLSGLEPDVDVSIAYTGLRPGEKLFEELFGEGEREVRSTAEGVRIASSRPLPLGEVEAVVERLKEAALADRRDEQFELIRRLVPGYRFDPSIEGAEPVEEAKHAEKPVFGPGYRSAAA